MLVFPGKVDVTDFAKIMLFINNTKHYNNTKQYISEACYRTIFANHKNINYQIYSFDNFNSYSPDMCLNVNFAKVTFVHSK